MRKVPCSSSSFLEREALHFSITTKKKIMFSFFFFFFKVLSSLYFWNKSSFDFHVFITFQRLTELCRFESTYGVHVVQTPAHAGSSGAEFWHFFHRTSSNNLEIKVNQYIHNFKSFFYQVRLSRPRCTLTVMHRGCFLGMQPVTKRRIR